MISPNLIKSHIKGKSHKQQLTKYFPSQLDEQLINQDVKNLKTGKCYKSFIPCAYDQVKCLICSSSLCAGMGAIIISSKNWIQHRRGKTHRINMKKFKFVKTSAEPPNQVENQDNLRASNIVGKQTTKCEQTVSNTKKPDQTNEVVKNLIINVCHQSFSHISNSKKILCMICLPQRDIKIPQDQWAKHNTDKFHQKKKEMFFIPVQQSNKLINPHINMHDKISQYPQHYIERQMQLKVVEPWLLQYLQPEIEHIHTRIYCRALVPVILPISKANGDFEIETLLKCTICNLNIQFAMNFEKIWTSHKNSDYHVIESQNYQASNGVNSSINIEEYANILEFQRSVKFKYRSNLEQETITKQTSDVVKQRDKNNELLDMEIESDTTEEVGTFLNPKETNS